MGIVAGIGAAAAAGSLANTVNSMANSGGGSSSQIPSVYQPGNSYGQDESYNNLLYGIPGATTGMISYGQELPGMLLPGYQRYAGNIQNNPYATMATQGATGAAALGQPISNMQIGNAGALSGAGNQILNSSMDPQLALYAQLQNQTNQGANVANAQAGVRGPAAAGTINQANQDFNLAWQNAQLQRQLSGAQGAGQAFSGASGLGGAGINTLMTSQALPYQTYLGQQGDYLNALNSQSSGALNAFGLGQQSLQDIQSYLGLGQSASDIGRLNASAAFGQNQILGQQLGQNLNALAGPLQNAYNSYGSPQAMSGIPGGYTNVNPNTFDYSGGSSGLDYMAA